MSRPKSNSKTKICKKCNKVKSKKYFYTTSSYCKKCQRIAVIENQKKNAKYYNEYRNDYSKINPAKRRAWSRISRERWEKKHGMKYSDHLKEIRRRRMAEDEGYRARIKKASKKYRLKAKEKIADYRRRYYLENREAFISNAMERHRRKKLTPN